MIVLWDQAYYVPGLTKDLCTIYLQASFTSGVYKGTFVEYCHNEHNIDAQLNLKEEKTGWQTVNLWRGFT